MIKFRVIDQCCFYCWLRTRLEKWKWLWEKWIHKWFFLYWDNKADSRVPDIVYGQPEQGVGNSESHITARSWSWNGMPQSKGRPASVSHQTTGVGKILQWANQFNLSFTAQINSTLPSPRTQSSNKEGMMAKEETSERSDWSLCNKLPNTVAIQYPYSLNRFKNLSATINKYFKL